MKTTIRHQDIRYTVTMDSGFIRITGPSTSHGFRADTTVTKPGSIEAKAIAALRNL